MTKKMAGVEELKAGEMKGLLHCRGCHEKTGLSKPLPVYSLEIREGVVYLKE